MFGCPVATLKRASFLIKRDFDLFGSPPTIYRCCAFNLHNQFLLKRLFLAFSNRFSTVEIHSIHLSLLPLISTLPFTHLFKFDKALHGVCMLCYVVVIFFLHDVAKISQGWRRQVLWEEMVFCLLARISPSPIHLFYRKKILWILLVINYIFNNFIKCNIKLNN